MNEEIARQVLEDFTLHTVDSLLHGFVVMLDGKIWKSNMGAFIFETAREANQAFYNGERWRFTRRYSMIVHGTDGLGWPIHYDRSTEAWRQFKRLVNYQVVAI